MVIALLCSLALGAEGFEVSVDYTSSFGPDAYGVVEATAYGHPGLEIGALVLGGVRSGLFATAGRTLRLTEGWRVRGQARLGMVASARRGDERRGGPSFGVLLGTMVDAGPLAVVAEGEWLRWIGFRTRAGVDAPLSQRWILGPRLRLETWAGDRDPALRVEMGVEHRFPSGWTVALAGSAGGRDVLHTGPGFVVTVGRR